MQAKGKTQIQKEQRVAGMEQRGSIPNEQTATRKITALIMTVLLKASNVTWR